MEDEKLVDYVMAGKRVRMARVGKGMAQEELANAAGVSAPYLSHIEHARSKASLTTFVRLANALNLTLNDLFCDSLKVSGVAFENQIQNVLRDCSSDEIRFIASSIEAMKNALREHDRRVRTNR